MNRLNMLALLGLIFLAGCGPSLVQQRNEGLASLNAADNVKAQKQFQIIADRYPGDAMTFFYLGRSYHAQGQYEMAIFEYQNALTINPGLTEASQWLDRAIKESGQTGAMLKSTGTAQGEGAK